MRRLREALASRKITTVSPAGRASRFFHKAGKGAMISISALTIPPRPSMEISAPVMRGILRSWVSRFFIRHVRKGLGALFSNRYWAIRKGRLFRVR